LPPGEYFVSVTPPDPSTIGRTGRPDSVAIAGPGGPGNGGAFFVNSRTNGPSGEVTQMQIMQPGAQPAQVYFAGVLDAESAAVIPVAAAADVRGIDINVRPIPTVTVRGRVLTSFPVAAQQGLPRPPAGGDRVFEILGGAIQIAITRVGGARTDLLVPPGG